MVRKLVRQELKRKALVVNTTNNYIDTQEMLRAYRSGIFPMAIGKESNSISWIRPIKRGIIPIGYLHISRSTKKFIRKTEVKSSINTCFKDILKNCANREDTWINKPIYESYIRLYELGYAHSVEIWEGSALAGGLFGISIGSCFFGESMFSLRPNGSKLALIFTMASLIYSGYKLFDVQFLTDHLKTMGAKEINNEEYQKILSLGLKTESNLLDLSSDYSWSKIIQLNNQKL